MEVFENPKVFIFRKCRSSGLMSMRFQGECIPGYKFNIHVENPKELHDYWSSLNPHKKTILYGKNEKFLTLKQEMRYGGLKTIFTPQIIMEFSGFKKGGYYYVDVKFAITGVFTSNTGKRIPKLN